MELRDYQREAVDTINALPDGARSICCLATGLGKTVVAANIDRKKNGRILWLSHRDELVRQPEKYFADKGLSFGIEKAGEHSHGEDVVSASVQTLSRDARLAKFDPEEFDIIICDEAHHAAARTYRKILDYFRPRKLIGLTATPKRSDNVRLTDVFDNISFMRDLRWGIRNGYLSRIRCVRVEAEYDMKKVRQVMGDFTPGGLGTEMEGSNVDLVITKAYLDYCRPYNRQTLIYCPTVAICTLVLHTMRRALPEDERDTVQMIYDGTDKKERAQILQDYMDGKVHAIINCMVLTEGTDLPGTSCIINNRPTSSDTLYQQIIGRGTRLCEGKEYCLIIDVEGKNAENRAICTAPTLFGLEPDQMPQQIRDAIDETTDLLDFSDDVIEQRAGIAKNLKLRSYILNVIHDDYLSLIQKYSESGCAALAGAYRTREESKLSDYDMGDIYARKMYDDDHFLRIKATYNGLIYLSRPDVLGNTVIDAYIPAEETKDMKDISFKSGSVPFEEAVGIVQDILNHMVHNRYRSLWSKSERERIASAPATPKQWGLISSQYDEFDMKPKSISMLDVSDLLDLRRDIDEVRLKKKRIKEEEEEFEQNGGYVLPPIPADPEEDEESFKEVLARLGKIKEKYKKAADDLGEVKHYRYSVPPSAFFSGASYPASEKQISYAKALIRNLRRHKIYVANNYVFNEDEWDKGTVSILIGLLKRLPDTVLVPPEDDYYALLDMASIARDIRNITPQRSPKIDCRYVILKKDRGSATETEKGA